MDVKPAEPPPTSKKISRTEREQRYQQRGTILWFTGLSGAGKTTLSIALERALFERKALVTILDGDVVRGGLNKDLDFSPEDRKENIRRIGEVARLLSETGIIVIVAFISPFRADRDQIRASIDAGRFIEVFVDCPLEICEQRDTKGLYLKARKGEILNFTGISSPYEPPLNPEIHIRTDIQKVHQCVNTILSFMENNCVFLR
ncbi:MULTISPECIES: adenylyl-sulfate kinase [unclassified Nitrospina]|uniref:adenylyl-sulfate kinase n=1 Tax=unclassified Nitrospina TaxID=2638683 RepID=UPI003F9D3284